MKTFSYGLLAAVAVCAATTAPTAVLAQDQSVIEEIVVTARKRSEALEDIPASMNVFSAEELDVLREAGAVGDICLRFNASAIIRAGRGVLSRAGAVQWAAGRHHRSRRNEPQGLHLLLA